MKSPFRQSPVCHTGFSRRTYSADIHVGTSSPHLCRLWAAQASLTAPLILCLVMSLRLCASAQQTSNSPPVLLLQQASNQGLVFSWPGNATDYVLEQSDLLGDSANWQTVAQGLVLAGSSMASVQVDPSSGTKFFHWHPIAEAKAV
jgi:hypothetical protein